MDENVALDSSKQKQFLKSVRGIKKKLNKKEEKPESLILKAKAETGDDNDKVKKKHVKNRGLVYLSHIPHGFYEHQMTQYFKQFGKVTNARVIRSKRTGNSKGCAFVEFAQPAVAQVVADTMNNYLMGKRLLKAEYVPPEKQRQYAKRKFWNKINNPSNNLRIEMKKTYNKIRTPEEELAKARKLIISLTRTKKKLAAIGINYDSFMPVDIPEELKDWDFDQNKKEPSLKIEQEKIEKIQKPKSMVKGDKPKKSSKAKKSSIIKKVK